MTSRIFSLICMILPSRASIESDTSPYGSISRLGTDVLVALNIQHKDKTAVSTIADINNTIFTS